MKLYVAPLEGITGYIFRNAYNEVFGQDTDKYFTPFLTPCEKKAVGGKEIKEVAPENNKGINLVPQVMTVVSDDFDMVKNRLRGQGYGEVNINLGCPSRTVTSKGRGSGALRDLTKLEEFLDGVFENGDDNISIKTRIGVEDPCEFYKIMEIYNKYPIRELTIHPRVMNEFYKGKPHIDVFKNVLSVARMPICYNGDINTVEDYTKLVDELRCVGGDKVSAVMIGRGILRDPALIRKITGTGNDASGDETYEMLCKLKENYQKEFSGQVPVLFKLKEIWTYLGQGIYKEEDKLLKKIMKSKSLNEYDVYARELTRSK